MKLSRRLLINCSVGGRKEYGPLAQLAEQGTLNAQVAGSTPARLTKIVSTNLPGTKTPLLNTATHQLHLGISSLYISFPVSLYKSTDSAKETFLSEVSAGDVGKGCCRRRRRVIAGNGAIDAAGILVEVVS